MEELDERIRAFLTPSSGDGSGDGDGYGYGPSEINGLKVYRIDDTPTVIHAVRGQLAQGAILGNDLTLTPCYIARVGDSFAHGETARAALEDAERKWRKEMPLEDRIKAFVEAYPDPYTPIPGKALFEWHNTLTGSCRMGREQFCRNHGWDPETTRLTAGEFIRATVNAYGGDVIRKLAEAYGLEV